MPTIILAAVEQPAPTTEDYVQALAIVRSCASIAQHGSALGYKLAVEARERGDTVMYDSAVGFGRAMHTEAIHALSRYYAILDQFKRHQRTTPVH